MPYIVRDLGTLTVQTSSGGAALSSSIGHLDDATAITIYLTSSALSAGSQVQISQFDPADPFPQVGVTQSSAFFLQQVIASSVSSITINPVAFRGMQMSFTATSSAKGEIMAYVTKSITV